MKRALFVVLAVAVLCGCAKLASVIPASREKDTYEALADENKSLKKQLDAEIQVNHRLAYDLEKSRIDLEKAQASLTAAGAQPAATVPAFQDYEIAKIEFGFLTGPAEWNGSPGYDGIMVYLLLRDSDGDVIKRRGNCAFDLIDVSRGEKAVMSWGVPSEVLGESWHSVPASFRIKLPWQGDPPYGDQVVLRATFTDAYGRNFTTSQLFTLKPLPPSPEKKEAAK